MQRAFLFMIAISLATLATAQTAPVFESVAETQRTMALARTQSDAARRRAEVMEANAASVAGEADRTARQSAAIAARIQQTQAEIAGHEANIRLIARARWDMRQELARQQKPLVELTAALQRLSRRPPALSLLRPGSLTDSIRLRAIIATILPQVERRTASLRAQIARRRALDGQSRLAAGRLRKEQDGLRAQRLSLATLETRQRLQSREVSGEANREAERALALAEQARDLGSLVTELARSGELRVQLAALPGPIFRPAQPADAISVAQVSPAVTPPTATSPGFVLPVTGRLIAGFGESRTGLAQSRGVAFATQSGAQAVAPAAGRIAFAGPYRGYGNIVILEHDGGWTSLVTGLAQLDTRVGMKVVAGSPLGIAGAGRPVVSLELRRNGTALSCKASPSRSST